MRSLFVFALLLSGCSAQIESAPATADELTILHLNDTYRVGAVEDGAAGGFGRVITVIRELQASGRVVHITHGGDFLYPSLESQLWHGQQMVEALNFIDDIAPLHLVAGNHEFDSRSPERLADAVSASRFDWLGDNYVFRSGNADVDSSLQKAFRIRHGGREIGVFALGLHADHGGNAREYLDVDPDYLGAARRVIEELEQSGVDMIIGLTHLHMATDFRIAELRAEYPKFMFIVGGHDHDPVYRELTTTSAAVMKGSSNAREIWQIDVTFDADGQPLIAERRLVLDESVEQDVEYANLDRKWRARLLEVFPFLEARVGTAALPMDSTEATIRNREASWPNFIADQMRGAFGEPFADFAFMNSGSLRIDDYVTDDILFEDIARTFGFSSFLRRTTVTGAEFRGLMEAGFRGDGTPSQGYFPVVSGFRVCFDPRRADGDRIVSLQVPGAAWQEIDPEASYSLVVPDFIYGGGDGYGVPQDRPVTPPGSELKYLVLDAILRAQAEGRAVGEAVSPEQPRLLRLSDTRPDCWPD